MCLCLFFLEMGKKRRFEGETSKQGYFHTRPASARTASKSQCLKIDKLRNHFSQFMLFQVGSHFIELSPLLLCSTCCSAGGGENAKSWSQQRIQAHKPSFLPRLSALLKYIQPGWCLLIRLRLEREWGPARCERNPKKASVSSLGALSARLGEGTRAERKSSLSSTLQWISILFSKRI